MNKILIIAVTAFISTSLYAAEEKGKTSSTKLIQLAYKDSPGGLRVKKDPPDCKKYPCDYANPKQKVK